MSNVGRSALAGILLLILCMSAQAADSAPESKIPAEQLDALVAPIALYPDPLLAQTLAAATYPLEIVQLQQWLQKNPSLKDKALADAVAKQPWDPSVQAMAGLPDVVKRLSDDIQWTTDLGNAFLAQQSESDGCGSAQLRTKAQSSGNLKSNEQQKVETKVVEQKQVDRRRAGESGSHLRAVVQPGRRVRASGLSIPADLLPPTRLLRGGRGHHLRCRRRHGRDVERRLGLEIAAGADSSNVNINVNNNFNRVNHYNNVNRTTNVRGAATSWQPLTPGRSRRHACRIGIAETANRYGGSACVRTRRRIGRALHATAFGGRFEPTLVPRALPRLELRVRAPVVPRLELRSYRQSGPVALVSGGSGSGVACGGGGARLFARVLSGRDARGQTVRMPGHRAAVGRPAWGARRAPRRQAAEGGVGQSAQC